MPFMMPEYLQEPFVVATDSYGESVACPLDCFSFRDFDRGPRRGREGVVEARVHAEYYAEDLWWARLAAPGYLDATEWSGPFATLEEAQAHIREVYDVHPESGETLGVD